ncbi:uncharacterized protein MELLADRAFT_118211 [Melampsora larici-populina 98AG31]|uniref:Uncharacterized protein n=1 Tax=Melampsora larici-populina (strain 98AG31 / pathotype 3-4-7) TaxID=747676 RepID=F4S6A5_MELLP|nr:uncharacterized protein MELLADRAFT_118211 [Melampsora larici-populina 98AG31]EGF99833.1 hypothetical protein MELLADRAFT_118211 [Melampsora larici-populina 98AG31]
MNTKETFNLPTQTQLKDHLKLLKAFSNLKHQVQSSYKFNSINLTLNNDNEYKFNIFLHLAVDRFEKWLKIMGHKGYKEIRLDDLPPLDVLMVWHSYCLNPRWYCEDSLRLHSGLRIPFPLEIAASNIQFDSTGDVITSSLNPSQEKSWISEVPFDPRLNASISSGRVISCPNCQADLHLAWTSADHTGWVDEACLIKCDECQEWSGDRLVLGRERFISDLRQVIKSPVDHHTIAGTLTTLQNLTDFENATRLKLNLIKIITESGTSLDSLSGSSIETILKKSSPKARWLRRSLSAYSSGTPFSIDLASAVIRQSSFVGKMVDLGFTNLIETRDGQPVLQRCLDRYQAFLSLMRSDSSTFFVPTIDIDLAWHTHQLVRGWKYCQDTIDLVGRLVDHNDDVEESQLSDSFEKTSKAWKDMFGVSYSGCDCSLDHFEEKDQVCKEIITLLDHELQFEEPIFKRIDDHNRSESLGFSETNGFVFDNLKQVIGSACGGCGGGGGCGGCGTGGCGAGIQSFQQKISACGGCGGCGSGGCGSGGCGGGMLNSYNKKISACGGCGGCGSGGGCGAGGCGGGMLESFNKKISACGGCGAGGCGGGLV